MKIDDGTGNANQAKVDDSNNLHVRAVNVPVALYAAIAAKSFGVVTGPITLTTAGESGILYIKCTDSSNPINVLKQLFYLGPSTGGTGPARLRVYRNPTGGTLLSGGTALTAANLNFSSSLLPNTTILKGAEGLTVTGGSTIIDIGMNTSFLLSVDDINWLLPNGSSYAVTITPPTSNTSMVVYERDKFFSFDQATIE